MKISQEFDEPRILSGNIKRIVVANSTHSGDSTISTLSTICKTPIFDGISILTTDSNMINHSSGAVFDDALDVEPPMVCFKVVENIWNREVTVQAALSNAVLVPTASHILDLVEYIAVTVEDISAIVSYYITECQLPSDAVSSTTLPASLLQVLLVCKLHIKMLKLFLSG